MTKARRVSRCHSAAPGVPFARAEDAWRWAHAGRRAQLDGARFSAGLADVPRPCEPGDILLVVRRLHRAGRLDRDHLLVLARCGGEEEGPASPERQRRAWQLWDEAMDCLSAPLRAKGIVASNEENKT